MSPQARETKAKLKYWDFVELKSFCTAKETISKTKRQPTEWEKIFVNDISDKELVFKIYKELIKRRARQDGRGVGSPSHLSPPTYLDNFQIILKTYEFNLRFQELSLIHI